MSAPILIIEDNEQNRYLLRYLLERNGYQVECSPDGKQGVEMAAVLRPCLILLDIQLPGMDGYTVASVLRATPSLSGIPIVAITSFAMAGDREKCLAAGCSGYIEKPINPDTFLDEINSYLNPDFRPPSPS